MKFPWHLDFVYHVSAIHFVQKAIKINFVFLTIPLQETVKIISTAFRQKKVYDEYKRYTLNDSVSTKFTFINQAFG